MYSVTLAVENDMTVMQMAGICFVSGIGTMLVARAVPSSQALNGLSLALVFASPVLAIAALAARLTGGA